MTLREDTVFLSMTENVLSLSARKYAIDYFEENKKYLEANYNVMKTWQAPVAPDDDLLLEMANNIKSVCETVTNRKYKINSGKFINYVKDSYCKGHGDDIEASHLSVITMIDMSSDLLGGEAYFARDAQSEHTHKMIPGPLKSGDCLMYGHNVQHGVEKVFSGRRLVFVLWLLEKD